MATAAVCGLQWGDEGKGKLVTRLARDFDYVVRYQGGGNAGHTVYVNGQKLVLHHIPCGIVTDHAHCLLMPGMVLNPDTVLEEIKRVEALGISTLGRIHISNRIQITAPYHRTLDQLRESGDDQAGKIGTTGRGIGTTYADKAMRFGVRACDLLCRDSLKDLVTSALQPKNLQMQARGLDPIEVEPMVEQLLAWGEQLKPYIADTSMLLAEALASGKRALFEGAQAAMLDLDMGTYPYVTSSTCLPGGISSGCGVNVGGIGEVIGVAKAYCTRVGLGGFPTEDDGPAGQHMRDVGGEYGSTTGRPRRCGWFDAHAVRTMVKLGGFTSICMTKLDVLAGLPEIKIGVGYENWSEPGLPASHRQFDTLKPRYITLPGFTEDISNARTFSDLPANAQAIVNAIEEHSGCQAKYLSTGPGTEQLIVR